MLTVGVSLTAWTLGAAAQDSVPSADAQPSTPDPYDQLVDGGVAEFASGHWLEARTLFERAHLLRPSARTLRALGMSAFNLHRYAQAVAELEAALRDPEQPLEGAMRAQAVELVRRAAPLVGRFAVTRAPPDATLQVDDGAPVHDPEGRVLLDIGLHQLALAAPGHATAKEALEVHGGEDDALALHALPLAALAEPARPSRSPRLRRRAVLALSLATVGLAVAAGGLASWLRADHRYDALDDSCRARGGCLPGSVDLGPVHRLENLAYGLAGVGGGLFVGGATLGAFELFARKPARTEPR